GPRALGPRGRGRSRDPADVPAGALRDPRRGRARLRDLRGGRARGTPPLRLPAIRAARAPFDAGEAPGHGRTAGGRARVAAARGRGRRRRGPRPRAGVRGEACGELPRADRPSRARSGPDARPRHREWRVDGRCRPGDTAWLMESQSGSAPRPPAEPNEPPPPPRLRVTKGSRWRIEKGRRTKWSTPDFLSANAVEVRQIDDPVLHVVAKKPRLARAEPEGYVARLKSREDLQPVEPEEEASLPACRGAPSSSARRPSPPRRSTR